MQKDTTTSVPLNTTAVTKSKEQILIQSSGAMVAIIVIGIIIILTFLFIVLKTYNRRTHTKRMLNSTKPKKKTSSSTTNTNLAMSNMGPNSANGSIMQSASNSNTPSENGFRIPRVDLRNMGQFNGEHFSNTSGSTVVTIHDLPSVDNT